MNLDLDYRQSGANSRICVYLLEGTRRINAWERSGPGEGGQTITIPHTQSGLFRYTLRICGHTSGGGLAAFALRRLKTIFQENIFSLPGLYPGYNVVTVKAEAGLQLARRRLLVTYEWDEGRDWRKSRSITKAFRELPGTFRIKVAGPKMPRMKKLAVKLERER